MNSLYDLIGSTYTMTRRADSEITHELARLVGNEDGSRFLDLACGTGNYTSAIADSGGQWFGIDISEGMLAIAQEKIVKRKEGHRMQVQLGDSENLVFEDHTFDAVTVSFGVRNFENLTKGLDSIYRVLKPGGKLVVLEFSNPTKFPIKQLYQFYSFKLLPIFGKLFSNDARAYTYLPESVKAFPDGAQFLAVMQRSGFVKSESKSLGMGICSIYIGVKN